MAKHSREDDPDAELAFHIEMQTRRFVADGMTPDDARARAAARLGDLQHAREECRVVMTQMETEMERTAWWQGVWQDVVYAARMLRRAPAFTATALLMIAIGVGANTAIFSVVRAAMFDTLPYRDPGRLALVWNAYKGGLSQAAVAAAEFAEMREGNHAFSAMAAIRPQDSSLSGDCSISADCNPEPVLAYVVSPNLFDLLGVRILKGRTFAETDGADSAEKVVILTDGLWERRFGRDVSILGRSIMVGGGPRTVIGIAPPGVRFPDALLGYLEHPADLWIPYSWEQKRTDGRGNQYLAVIARVKPELPSSAAQAELDVFADRFRAAYPDRYAKPGLHWRIEAVSLRDQMVGDARTPLLILSGAVGLVLFIACANVANLLLARGSSRRQELAVRSALGAGRTRLVRQLLVEALVLTAAGALIGVGLAAAGVKGLLQLDAGSIPRLQEAGVSGPVLAFSAALAVLTGLLVGLVPALRQSRVDPQSALRETGRAVDAAPHRRRLRRLFVVVEVTMAVIVLVGAGLMIRSFIEMTRVNAGFDPSNTMVAEVTLPRARYNPAAKVLQFQLDFASRLRALPGVTHASAIYPLPMSGDGWGATLGVDGQPDMSGQPDPHAEFGIALPDYFQTARISLLEGRDFAVSDDASAPPVAVVDEVLAKQYWPGQSAIGKRIGFGGVPQTPAGWLTVIGVVAHVRNAGPRQEGEPQVYMAALQKPEVSVYFLSRTDGDPRPLASAMRASLRAIDPGLPIAKLDTMTTVVAHATSRERFNMLLLTVFGVMALALAAGGLYGVMSYLVTEQSREIGIRLALGGGPGRVLGRIVGEGVVVTLVGVICGCALALWLSRAVADLLFVITPSDPLTYAAIAVLLIMVAAIASYVPARRAVRIDPVEVLRG